MAATPEMERGEVSAVQERAEEFPIDETLKNAGAQVVQKTFKAQVRDNKGVPLIQTPPAQVITVATPAPQATLTSWSKGSITSSLTWFGAFWLRVIKKALHFGWKIVSGSSEKNPPITN